MNIPHFERCTPAALLCAALVCFTLFAGCGTMPNGRGWGQDATLLPGWDRIGRAALNAAKSPGTWVPAASALAFHKTGNADRNVSEWASKNTPIFGSQENAARMSDILLDTTGAAFVTSTIAAPSGDDVHDWMIAKIQGGTVEATAGLMTAGTVGYLKNATGRMRPNGSNTNSFPSGHSAGAAFFSTMAYQNFEAMGLSSGADAAARISLSTLTAATAWARVEAKVHYPSDVLAGIAIGHFTGTFFTDAFLGLDNPRHVVALVEPSKEGVLMLVRCDF